MTYWECVGQAHEPRDGRIKQEVLCEVTCDLSTE